MTSIRIQLLFLTFCSTMLFAQGEKISGTIYFEDGTNQTFNNITGFVTWKPGTGGPNLAVTYKNSDREIPFSKLLSFEVKYYNVEFFDGGLTTYYYIGDATVVVKTVTGVSIETHYEGLIEVATTILDELTGEMKDQYFKFCQMTNKKEENKLLIRKIIFNNELREESSSGQ